MNPGWSLESGLPISACMRKNVSFTPCVCPRMHGKNVVEAGALERSLVCSDISLILFDPVLALSPRFPLIYEEHWTFSSAFKFSLSAAAWSEPSGIEAPETVIRSRGEDSASILKWHHFISCHGNDFTQVNG